MGEANYYFQLEDLPLGKIRETDVLFVAKHDGTCSRCREQIAEPEVPLLLWLPGRKGRDMYAFCQRCAFDPDSDRCKVCGCSQHNPCDEGCGWEAPGLCTACADGVFEASRLGQDRPGG